MAPAYGQTILIVLATLFGPSAGFFGFFIFLQMEKGCRNHIMRMSRYLWKLGREQLEPPPQETDGESPGSSSPNCKIESTAASEAVQVRDSSVYEGDTRDSDVRRSSFWDETDFVRIDERYSKKNEIGYLREMGVKYLRGSVTTPLHNVNNEAAFASTITIAGEIELSDITPSYNSGVRI